MKSVIAVVRWILVLPAAIAASFLLEAIMAEIQHLGWATDPLTWGGQCLLDGVVFVLAGSVMAPRRKFATSVGLAIVGGVLIGVLAMIGWSVGDNRWSLIVRLILSSVGIANGCLAVWAWEVEKAKGKINDEMSKQPRWDN